MAEKNYSNTENKKESDSVREDGQEPDSSSKQDKNFIDLLLKYVNDTAKSVKDATDKKMQDVDEKIKELESEKEKIEKDFSNFKDSDFKDIKKEVEQQKNRVPEIVGLFSTIIAFVLIDVSIIKSAPNFLAAVLLIGALTCSLIIFAVLIHSFFSFGINKIETGIAFSGPIAILAGLIIFGIFMHCLGYNLYEKKFDNNEEIKNINVNINKPNESTKQQQSKSTGEAADTNQSQ